jgi:hypothetical protein
MNAKEKKVAVGLILWLIAALFPGLPHAVTRAVSEVHRRGAGATRA